MEQDKEKLDIRKVGDTESMKPYDPQKHISKWQNGFLISDYTECNTTDLTMESQRQDKLIFKRHDPVV